MNSNILVTVCARGGSKGIPGKNIKEVGGKPLIAYTIEKALEYAKKHGADIELSTDSDEIKKVAASYGLPTEYVRPEYLANDTVGKPDAIRDVMLYAQEKNGKKYDLVVDLDVTSPLRTLEDIEKCVAKIEADPQALTIFSVNLCARNPYFNQVQMHTPKEGEHLAPQSIADGYYWEVMHGTPYTTRQGSPKVYDINGSIYVYRPAALMAEPARAVTPHSLIYVMDHLCFDLDEMADYEYMDYILSKK